MLDDPFCDKSAIQARQALRRRTTQSQNSPPQLSMTARWHHSFPTSYLPTSGYSAAQPSSHSRAPADLSGCGHRLSSAWPARKPSIQTFPAPFHGRAQPRKAQLASEASTSPMPSSISSICAPEGFLAEIARDSTNRTKPISSSVQVSEKKGIAQALVVQVSGEPYRSFAPAVDPAQGAARTFFCPSCRTRCVRIRKPSRSLPPRVRRACTPRQQPSGGGRRACAVLSDQGLSPKQAGAKGCNASQKVLNFHLP